MGWSGPDRHDRAVRPGDRFRETWPVAVSGLGPLAPSEAPNCDGNASSRKRTQARYDLNYFGRIVVAHAFTLPVHRWLEVQSESHLIYVQPARRMRGGERQ